MWQLTAKALVSGIVVVAASELARRSTVWAAVLISLPLTSILALTWLYLDTKNASQVAQFSWSIMWIVLPSVVMFAALALLLRGGAPFVVALPGACLVMAAAYAGYVWALGRLGISL